MSADILQGLNDTPAGLLLETLAELITRGTDIGTMEETIREVQGTGYSSVELTEVDELLSWIQARAKRREFILRNRSIQS